MKESSLKGCFCSKAAFTLIELLVVVLIIGILAAVAVPQYTKAVNKSRIAEAKTVLKSLSNALAVELLENPEFAVDGGFIEDLSTIEAPQSDKFSYFIESYEGPSSFGIGAHLLPTSMVIAYYGPNHSDVFFRNKFICWDENGNSEEICPQFGAVLQQDDDDNEYWVLP